jgi:Ca2+-binding EF-hand superfamily protein
MKLVPSRLILVASIAIAAPVALFAAKGDAKTRTALPKVSFETADKDKDGSVTEAEYLAAMGENADQKRAKARFGQLDADHNGKLSKEEMEASGKKKKKESK